MRSSTCPWRWPRPIPVRPSRATSGSWPRCPATCATSRSRCPPPGSRSCAAWSEERRDAAAYQCSTFTTPWPEEFLSDHCELLRRMSTDEPAGDGDKEEEVWDGPRIREYDQLLEERGVWKLAAVARHVDSGHLVAFSELLFSPDAPTEAWQLATLVHPEHRGHRLGLAVKLANVDAAGGRRALGAADHHRQRVGERADDRGERAHGLRDRRRRLVLAEEPAGRVSPRGGPPWDRMIMQIYVY